MPVPKRKRSHSRKYKRNANKGWHPMAITGCKNCQSPLATHVACKECGYYKGVKVLETKTDRLLKRGKAQQSKATRTAARKPAMDASAESEQ
ncbi:MAG TPA: 50S ribosomal protein L32 [Candidatus Babeliales bacterium]|nr:50S ribosomal protein L32 [Candidatus Babeliales bacterium]